MTKPDDIPQDVWEGAYEAMPPVFQRSYDTSPVVMVLQLGISVAIMAEREACAQIADDDDGEHTIFGEDRNTRTAQRTARAIATAIRNRGAA